MIVDLTSVSIVIADFIRFHRACDCGPTSESRLSRDLLSSESFIAIYTVPPLVSNGMDRLDEHLIGTGIELLQHKGRQALSKSWNGQLTTSPSYC